MSPARSGSAMPPGRRRRWYRLTGTALILLGVVLLGGSIAYFVYGFKARSGLGELNYNPSTPLLADDSFLIYEAPPEMGALAVIRDGQAREGDGRSANSVPGWAIWDRVAYPGEMLRARYWTDPLAYEPRSVTERALVEGFDPVDPAEASPPGSLPPSTRIRIPAIDLDSRVEELTLTDLGDSRAYNTPKHVVGHIPEMANAGEKGTAWFFGHLESPIRGEGSVFRDLPKIPELLREGEVVYAIFDNGDTGFLYRLTSSEVLPEADLRLYDTEEATIRLVTCVPALYYDHRLVIWGELVGAKSN